MKVNGRVLLAIGIRYRVVERPLNVLAIISYTVMPEGSLRARSAPVGVFVITADLGPSHSGESLFFQTSVAIVIVFWVKWARYLAVAGLNLLPLLSNRVSPFGV